MRVQIGYQYTPLGTVAATPDGLQYTGDTARLELMVERLRTYYHPASDADLLTIIAQRLNNGYLWAHAVEPAESRAAEPDTTREIVRGPDGRIITNVGNGETPNPATRAHAAIEHAATTPEVLAALHAYAPHLALSGFERTGVEGTKLMAHQLVALGEQFPHQFKALGQVATASSPAVAAFVSKFWNPRALAATVTPDDMKYPEIKDVLDVGAKSVIILHPDLLNQTPSMQELAEYMMAIHWVSDAYRHPIAAALTHEFGHVYVAHSLHDAPYGARMLMQAALDKGKIEPINDYAYQNAEEAFAEAFSALYTQDAAEARQPGISQTRALVAAITARLEEG